MKENRNSSILYTCEETKNKKKMDAKFASMQ